MSEWVEVTQKDLPAFDWSWYACTICSTKKYCSSCIIKKLKVETPHLTKKQLNQIEKQIAKDYQLMLAESDVPSKA